MKRTHGFTVIELIVTILFLGLVTTLVVVQKNAITAAQRDTQRKTAINAMYYNLEEVFYEKNGYYPAAISSDTLRAMDPALFTDPQGVKIGEDGSDYRYETTNCTNDKCKGYTLRADLEKEAQYIKTNRSH